MSRRAAVREADVSRIVRGAVKGGWPVGTFIVEVVDGIVRLLPTLPVKASPSAPLDAELAEWDADHGYG